MANVAEKAPVTAGAAYLKKVEQSGQFLVGHGIDISQMTNEEIVSKVERIYEAQAVSAQVLSKGQVNDALEMLLKKIPKGYVGEFKRNSDTGIQRAQAMGWEVFIDETEKKASEKSDSPTGTADGRVRLGDLILMYMPDEKYIGHKLARQARIVKKREGRDPRKVGPSQGDGVENADPKFPIQKIGG